MATDPSLTEVLIKTDLGLVRVCLEPGQGRRNIRFYGADDAVDYVSMLFSNSCDERGALIGNSCTAASFMHVVTTTGMAKLVAWYEAELWPSF